MDQSTQGKSWLIKADRLSKSYLQFASPRDRLKHYLFGHRQAADEIKALSDISFEVSMGEVVGVIGNNGAGKSTLLQLVCGTVNPSAGTIQTRGRIAALLELGAGFNPEFTGRENIRLNAALLGFTKDEIDAAMTSIIEFADIAVAIDYAVKTYSTGMAMRLAFAIATSVKPDLLIIDEALSVGDGAFAKKSFERIMSLREAGCSILFCSHSLYHVESIADRVIWLEKGRLRMLGAAADTTRQYAMASLQLDPMSDPTLEPSFKRAQPSEAERPSVPRTEAAQSLSEALTGQAKLIQIESFVVRDQFAHSKTDPARRDNSLGSNGAMTPEWPCDSESKSQGGGQHLLRTSRDELVVAISFVWDRNLPVPTVAFSIEALERGIVITSGSSRFDRLDVPFKIVDTSTQRPFSELTVRLSFPAISLLHGSYAVNIFLACEKALHLYDYRNHAVLFSVSQEGLEQGFFFIPRSWDDSFSPNR